MAKARSRSAWSKKKRDQLRPLVSPGHDESQRLVPLLAAYDVTRLVSSSSTRCVQTLQPYADSTGWDLEARDDLSEEEASKKSVNAVVGDLLDDKRSSVLCTHRPVLPRVFEAIGVEDEKLEPAGFVVVLVTKRPAWRRSSSGSVLAPLRSIASRSITVTLPGTSSTSDTATTGVGEGCSDRDFVAEFDVVAAFDAVDPTAALDSALAPAESATDGTTPASSSTGDDQSQVADAEQQLQQQKDSAAAKTQKGHQAVNTFIPGARSTP